MNIHEAAHFINLLNTKNITSVFRTGNAAIEDCLVYSSRNKYGGNISVLLLSGKGEGFIFVKCDDKIVSIIDISKINSVETSFLSADSSSVLITYNFFCMVSLSVRNGSSDLNFNFFSKDEVV